MLNKNDPLINSVKKVMEQNQKERAATVATNQYFGIEDRKAVPHEHLAEWDAEYKKILSEGVEGSTPKTPADKQLAAKHGDKTKITHGDVLKARGVIKEGETADEVGKNENESGSAVTMKESYKSYIRTKLQAVTEEAKARSNYGLGAAKAPKNAAQKRAQIDKAMEPVVNTTKALLPGVDSFDKATQGDYKGAALSAAADLAGGALLKGAGKLGKAAYSYLKGGAKTADAANDLAKGTKAVAQSTGSTTTAAGAKAAEALKSKLASRGNAMRRKVPGAEPKAPVRTGPQSAAPQVAQGSGQANRLASPTRPASGPWGNAKPASRPASDLKAGDARSQILAKAKQNSTPNAAAGAASRIVNAVKQRPVSAGIGGAALGAFAARQSNSPAPVAASVVKKDPTPKNPNLGLAGNGKLQGQVSSTTPAPTTPKATTPAPTIKVSDTEVMNSQKYKDAVNSVGGNENAKKIQVGQNVSGLGRFNDKDTITSRVRTDLAAKKNVGRES